MRIAIVNDMPMAVEMLRRTILNSKIHQIAWTARDGAQAVSLSASDRPDLILMDLIMPVMDGVEATRRIMAATPCPILIVTATVEGNSTKVFEALGAGAFDAVNTPSFNTAQKSEPALLAKIDYASRLGVDLRIDDTAGKPVATARRSELPFLVAIGASAGGPAALAEVLAAFPAKFPAAVLVVQHIDEQFAPGLASWLSNQCKLPVRIAENGALIEPGRVLVAGTNDHLVLTFGSHVGYTEEPLELAYRPSVDVLFESIASRWRGELLAVVLTGMGRDGAMGLKKLRDAGHHTIAQDRATSAVYGMPKAAAALDAAVEILPLPRIGARVVELCMKGRSYAQ